MEFTLKYGTVITDQIGLIALTEVATCAGHQFNTSVFDFPIPVLHTATDSKESA